MTRAVHGPVRVAWTHTPEATIEGEPLVWDDRIVLCLRRPDGLRLLRVLDIATGTRRYDYVVRSTRPMDPSLWGKLIAFRNDDRVVVARLGASSLTPVFERTLGAQLGDPLIIEQDLFVPTADGLCHFDIASRKETWRARGRFEGEVAAIGNSLFAASTTAWESRLTRHDADSGELRWSETVGLISAAGGERDFWLTVHPAAAFVRSAVPLGGYQVPWPVHFSGVRLERASGPQMHPLAACLLEMPSPWEGGYLGLMCNADGQPVFARVSNPDDERIMLLAAKARAPELFSPPLPPTLAEGVCYFGPVAFSVSNGRVLWRAPLEPSRRPVIAGGTVLYVVDDQQLCAVRSRSTSAEARIVLDASRSTFRGRVVLRDGTIEEGQFTLDGAARSVVREAKPQPKPRPFAELLLAEDADGGIVMASEIPRAFEHLAEHLRGERYLALARESRSATDPLLLSSLIASASRNGIEDKALEELRKLVESWSARPELPRPKAELVESLRKKVKQADAIPFQVAWQRLERLPEALKGALETTLLRAVLQQDVAYPAALERVKLLLPESLRPAGAFDVHEALRFVDASQRHRIEFVKRPELGQESSFDQSQVERRRATLGKDIQGIRSDNLLIISRTARYGSLANALAVGELTCRMLEELLGTQGLAREAREPMVIELFASREDYLATDKRRNGPEGHGLEWTAGHYDLVENVSRFYVPVDEQELPGFLEIASHELTHHWLSARCPKWPVEIPGPALLERPGCWIVEGFPSWIQEFGFDVAHAAWSPGGESSPLLDILVGSDPKLLIPWKQLLSLSKARLSSIDVGSVAETPSTLYMGTLRTSTAMNRFYAQAAALTRWLYEADEGAHRRQLFDFLTAYYSGDLSRLDLEQSLGLDAPSIGQRVIEHSRRVLAGDGRR